MSKEQTEAVGRDIEGHLADAIRDTFRREAGKIIDFDTSSRMATAALEATSLRPAASGEVGDGPWIDDAPPRHRLKLEGPEVRIGPTAPPPDREDVLRGIVHSSAIKWCGEKERETSMDDVRYFEANWKALPGLRQYVAEAALDALLATPISPTHTVRGAYLPHYGPTEGIAQKPRKRH